MAILLPEHTWSQVSPKGGKVILSPGPERSSSRRVEKSHTASCGLQPPPSVSLVPAPRPYCTPSRPVLPADGGGGGLWRPATIRRTGPTVCPGSTQALLHSLQTSKCPMCRIGQKSNMVSILGLHILPKCHLLSINRLSKDRNRDGRFQVAVHKCRLLLDRGKVTEVVALVWWQESGALPRHSSHIRLP